MHVSDSKQHENGTDLNKTKYGSFKYAYKFWDYKLRTSFQQRIYIQRWLRNIMGYWMSTKCS